MGNFKLKLRSIIRKTLIYLLSSFCRLLGTQGRKNFVRVLNKATQDFTSAVLPKIIETIPTSRGDIKFCSIDELPLWRAHSLLTKEPETIVWIDGFEDDDVYWDIGANIGVYALYAGINKNIKVFAFEPSASNYMLINKNIELNNLSKSVKAFCMAFTDTVSLDELKMQNTEFGGALSSFGVPVDHDGKTFEPHFLQGMLGFSIDSFIDTFSLSFPNHIKIDVDGIENRIVLGAPKTFADPRLKSLSIELDANRPDYTNAVIANIEQAGLTLKSQRHASMFDDSPYSGIFNYLFTRE